MKTKKKWIVLLCVLGMIAAVFTGIFKWNEHQQNKTTNTNN